MQSASLSSSSSSSSSSSLSDLSIETVWCAVQRWLLRPTKALGSALALHARAHLPHLSTSCAPPTRNKGLPLPFPSLPCDCRVPWRRVRATHTLHVRHPCTLACAHTATLLLLLLLPPGQSFLGKRKTSTFLVECRRRHQDCVALRCGTSLVRWAGGWRRSAGTRTSLCSMWGHSLRASEWSERASQPASQPRPCPGPWIEPIFGPPRPSSPSFFLSLAPSGAWSERQTWMDHGLDGP